MKLKLIAKRPETEGVITFVFQPEELEWKAGQFVLYRLPHEGADDRKDRRFFTNSAAPFENEVRITTRIIDKGSTFKKHLNSLNVGDGIEAVRASGDFVMDDPSKEHVFIAGGIGITPFRSILKQLEHDHQPMKATLLYANRTPDFVFKDELDRLSHQNPGLKIHYFTDPQKIDEETIRKIVPNLENPVFWISGPEPMVEAYEKMLGAIGVPAKHIKTDFFPGYEWPDH